jgi:hypothetical protein
MKVSLLLSTLILTSALCADDDVIAAAQKPNGRSQKSMNNNDNNNNNNLMNVVTLTSARPESDNGWYLFADALYWHIDMENTEWAEVSNPASTNVVTDVHSLNFKWNWGFRVGIGANMNHDMWDTNFYYTWLFADNSNKAGREGAVVEDLIAGDDTTFKTGSVKWGVHFSMFDWELGRWHYVSKNLALRPHVGVKGGWIDQTVHAKFSDLTNPNNPAFRVDRLKNDFWGVGPSVGVNTMWVLGSAGRMMDHRFSLAGDFGGALMYGHFDISDRRVDRVGSQVEFNRVKGQSRNLAVTMLQGFLGLSWDVPFNKNKNHFMLKAGYELQYWLNEAFGDNFALQGVTGEFRFDF